MSRTDVKNSPSRLPRLWLALLLVWLPLMIAYAIAVARFSQIDALRGIRAAFVISIIAFVLGLGVWSMSGRFKWPEKLEPKFFGLHLIAALAYSWAWWSLVAVAWSVIEGTSLAAGYREWLASPVLGWDIFLGLTVYGLVVGISYAVRLRATIAQERLSLARAESATRSAQLQALEARLDPHFMFNTLHSVAALVRIDPVRAQDALDTLGDLLRASLSDRPEMNRTLTEELELVDGYLELERLRLGDRLKVVRRISDLARGFPVPPMLLQPLVENAIRHGISPRPNGGSVVIEAEVDNGTLILTVSDDGIGAPSPPAIDESGLGLSVLRARLDEMAPPGLITIKTGIEAGFTVTLSIPTSTP